MRLHDSGRWNPGFVGRRRILRGNDVNRAVSGTKSAAARFHAWRCPMSNEKPTADPRQKTDWGSHKQTDKPWKDNPEKEQRSDKSGHDLEKWHETKTH